MYRSMGWGVGVVKKGLSFWLTVSNIRLKQDSGLVGKWANKCSVFQEAIEMIL